MSRWPILGQRSDALLPLLEDSVLVVDASLSSVRGGITHSGVLLKLRKRGVRVFPAPKLHAKVFAFDSVGFVGSTNASTRSRDQLNEAVVRVKDAPTLADTRAYVDWLAAEEPKKADLDWLRKEYSPPSYPLPENFRQGPSASLDADYEVGSARILWASGSTAFWSVVRAFQFEPEHSTPANTKAEERRYG